MSVFERFGEEIARAQDAQLAGDDRLTRVRRRLLESAANGAMAAPIRAAARIPALAFGLAAAAAIAVVAVAIVSPWRADEAIRATVGEARLPLRAGEWVAAPQGSPRRIDFSDGSSFSLEPRSGARVVRLAADGARVSLERGTARVAVHKRPSAAWQVDVGPYAVAVKGTRFVVAWDPESQLFALTLEEGSVLVRGPLLADGRLVAAGETLRASVAENRLEISHGAPATAAGRPAPADEPAAEPGPPVAADDDADTDSACVPSEAAAPRVASQKGSAPDAAVAGWRRLAERGSYGAAVDAAEAEGIDAVLDRATPAELLLLGDAARLSKRLGVADRSYLAIRARRPGSAEAASAAFALGRLAFDHRRNYGKAAEWMELYLAEGGADAALAREALGRLVEAEQRAGDLDGAKNAAARYLARYPDGPHAEIARDILAATGADPGAAP